MFDFTELGIDTRGKRTGEVKTLCPECSASRSGQGRKDKCLRANLDTEV